MTMMHGPDHPSEQTPHLAPAWTAVALVAMVLMALGPYARSLERRSIAAVAADEDLYDQFSELYRLKNQGTALQSAAFEADGLLPVYGSSELDLLLPYNRPFHSSTLFRDRPTGFTIFPVGKPATTCLIMEQRLAAVGPALKGRKLAISVSPFYFFDQPMAWSGGYAGSFSPLHSGELAFNTGLSLQLRQETARRMLQYPETLAKRPLLKFALENLADGSPWALACYQAALPLGMMQNAILRYQDHWSIVRYAWKPRARSATPATGGRALDWPSLHRQAIATYRPRSDNNEFGLDNKKWLRKIRPEALRIRNTRTDESFLRDLHENQEWVDLELLLRLLTEYGARPILLSMPMHGAWYDQWGVSYTARRAYYQRLRETGARFGTPVVDFAEHDSDRDFCFDHRGHLSPVGWLYYGQVLDGFFHDALPLQSELSTTAPVEKTLAKSSEARTPNSRE